MNHFLDWLGRYAGVIFPALGVGGGITAAIGKTIQYFTRAPVDRDKAWMANMSAASDSMKDALTSLKTQVDSQAQQISDLQVAQRNTMMELEREKARNAKLVWWIRQQLPDAKIPADLAPDWLNY